MCTFEGLPEMSINNQQFLWSPYLYAGAGKDPTLLLIFNLRMAKTSERLNDIHNYMKKEGRAYQCVWPSFLAKIASFVVIY